MKAPYPDIVFDGPHKSPVEARNEVCLTCHQAGLVMNWQGSAMQRAGVACTDCHTAHAAKDPVLVKATQPQVCFTCHAGHPGRQLQVLASPDPRGPGGVQRLPQSAWVPRATPSR